MKKHQEIGVKSTWNRLKESHLEVVFLARFASAHGRRVYRARRSFSIVTTGEKYLVEHLSSSDIWIPRTIPPRTRSRCILSASASPRRMKESEERRNASNEPVLKHGPRSQTILRALGLKTHERNESKGTLRGLRCASGKQFLDTALTDHDLRWKIWVWVKLFGPERWWTLRD